jgi:hypothetical protein
MRVISLKDRKDHVIVPALENKSRCIPSCSGQASKMAPLGVEKNN